MSDKSESINYIFDEDLSAKRTIVINADYNINSPYIVEEYDMQYIQTDLSKLLRDS